MRLQLPPPRGFARLQSAYSASFVAWLKSLPGCRWWPEERVWLIPQELHGAIALEAERRQLTPRFTFGESVRSAPIGAYALYPPQQAVLGRCLERRSLLISAEPGCGKTAIALSCAAALGAQRTLIVCPAGVREQWKREIARWWPTAPAVTVITSRPDWDECEAGQDGVYITSYELLEAIPTPLASGLILIIFDEAQALKHYRTVRSKAARVVANLNRGAVLLALTGTPIDVDPGDLFNLLDILRPRGFGTYPQFRERYLATSENSAGYLEVTGANHETVGEFRQRLDWVSARFTLADVAPWLPKLRTDARYLAPELGGGLAGRCGAVLAWHEEIRNANEQERTCIVVYHRDVAKALAESLAPSASSVVYVDGESSQLERTEQIASVLRTPGSVLVATMKAIGVGRDDLVAFREVCVAEIYPAAGVMAQLVGRWHRLSSPHSTRISFLVAPEDEQHVLMLTRRNTDAGELLTPGAGELALNSLQRSYSDSELLAMFEE